MSCTKRLGLPPRLWLATVSSTEKLGVHLGCVATSLCVPEDPGQAEAGEGTPWYPWLLVASQILETENAFLV